MNNTRRRSTEIRATITCRSSKILPKHFLTDAHDPKPHSNRGDRRYSDVTRARAWPTFLLIKKMSRGLGKFLIKLFRRDLREKRTRREQIVCAFFICNCEPTVSTTLIEKITYRMIRVILRAKNENVKLYGRPLKQSLRGFINGLAKLCRRPCLIKLSLN